MPKLCLCKSGINKLSFNTKESKAIPKTPKELRDTQHFLKNW